MGIVRASDDSCNNANVRDQLKILAVEQGLTMQTLVAEGFNMLFAKYGKPEIAPATEQGS